MSLKLLGPSASARKIYGPEGPRLTQCSGNFGELNSVTIEIEAPVIFPAELSIEEYFICDTM